MPSIPKLLMDEFYNLNREALADKDFGLAKVLSLAEDHVNSVRHGNTPEFVIDTVVKNFNGFIDNSQKYDMKMEDLLLVKKLISDFVDKHGLDGVDLEARW